MADILLIQANMHVKQSVLDDYYKIFVEQLKTGVVIIPALFQSRIDKRTRRYRGDCGR